MTVSLSSSLDLDLSLQFKDHEHNSEPTFELESPSVRGLHFRRFADVLNCFSLILTFSGHKIWVVLRSILVERANIVCLHFPSKFVLLKLEVHI